MFSQVILIDRGLKILLSNIKREGKTKKILSSFQGTTQKKESPVAITWWTHLYPSRTQKLSTIVALVSETRERQVAGLFFLWGDVF